MHDRPLAIVVAFDDEISIVASKMEIDARVHRRPALFTVGTLGRTPLVIARSGLGPAAMADAAAYLLEQYRPCFCLHVGCCGGAEPKDQPGDLIIADAVVDAKSGARYIADAGTVGGATSLCKAQGLRARVAALVTVEKPVGAPHEKAFVGTQHGAAGIDMESAPLAAACSARGTPWLVVRAILDPLDVALPEMGDVLDAEGAVDGVRLAGHLLRRPGDVLSLPRLQYFESEVKTAIARFVETWMKEPGVGRKA